MQKFPRTPHLQGAGEGKVRVCVFMCVFLETCSTILNTYLALLKGRLLIVSFPWEQKIESMILLHLYIEGLTAKKLMRAAEVSF